MRGLPKRRRQENKTDYNARLSILKSGKARLLVRRSNRHIIVQVVTSEKAQDTVVLTVNSKDLLSHGWPENKVGSLKSRPAAYLTGFLAAHTAAAKGIKEAVFDIGMHRNISKSRLYAVLKGAIDAGLKIPHSVDVLPDQKLLESSETHQLINKIKEKI